MLASGDQTLLDAIVPTALGVGAAYGKSVTVPQRGWSARSSALARKQFLFRRMYPRAIR